MKGLSPPLLWIPSHSLSRSQQRLFFFFCACIRDTPAQKKEEIATPDVNPPSLSLFSLFPFNHHHHQRSNTNQQEKKEKKRLFRNIMEACDTYSCTSHFTPTKSLFLWHSKRKETRNKHKKNIGKGVDEGVFAQTRGKT